VYQKIFTYSYCSVTLFLIATFIAEETSFSGDIPRLPPNLVNFDVSFAFFTGGLTDANFQGINTLNFIDVDGNAFNTTVPRVFGTLPNLQFLYLSDSFLSGDLSFTQGMTAMREIWIDTNPGISGPIFDYIGDITTLESLSMTFNSLTGTIPTTLGQLTEMLQMWLYSNQLTGPVPSQLGNLKSMTILQVEGNMLTGTMPTEICANAMFPTQTLNVLGADCEDGFTCTCCTCCGVVECTA
jgi:Leucine-rich repeat (LRR) protein